MRSAELTNSKGNKSCCFCYKDAGEYGNNPEPLMDYEDGKCCDGCNVELVLPYRILAYTDYDKFLKLKNQLIEKGIIKSKKSKL